ncbi:Uncharacterised protein [Chryseobacterium taklimakanense]|uniref:Uncharacterized protein n=1 Tax=Chryseobacterium taklimakanense TaxID=536441 RepID=A0A239XEC2_9FLAO|nr:Uncharacterised protein [Chryseobacterium taklimakanense]
MWANLTKKYTLQNTKSHQFDGFRYVILFNILELICYLNFNEIPNKKFVPACE